MSNVTGLVFKSHFRLNIIIFIRNVILSLLFGTSQSEKPRRRQTALLQYTYRHMYVCMRVYCVCMYVYICQNISIYMTVYKCICMHECMHVYMYTCMHCMHLYVCACIYVCMSAYMYVCVSFSSWVLSGTEGIVLVGRGNCPGETSVPPPSLAI